MKKLLPFLLILFVSCHEKETALTISGRIEGAEHDVGTTLGGKVIKVLAEEGKSVSKGQVLAEIDSRRLRARLKRAKAILASLKEKARSLRAKRDILSQEVRINLEVARKRREIAKRELLRLEHSREELEIRKDKLSKDLRRFRELFRKGAVPEAKLEEVETEFSSILERIKGVERAVEEMRKKVELAELEVRLAKTKKKELEVLDGEIRSLRRRIAEAQAGVEEADALLEDSLLRSPIQGTVVEKYVEEGEVVAPGKILFTVVDLDRLYFKGYLPETKLGLVRVGQKAYLKVDSFPNRKFPAVVSYVSDRAEFTPKEVQTREARVKQVFEVRLRLLENPGHVLKPGMPADAFIELR